MDLHKRKRTGFILMTAGAVAIVCTILFWVFGANFITTDYAFEQDQSALLDEEAARQAALAALANESIVIPGFESATIPADEETVELRLYNPENNNCYFEISITLTGSEEEIYKSNLIKPGQELVEITLNRGLEKGNYTAVMHYSAFTTDGSFTPLNGADIPFTLTAE